MLGCKHNVSMPILGIQLVGYKVATPKVPQVLLHLSLANCMCSYRCIRVELMAIRLPPQHTKYYSITI